jgi:hypothetical protein
LTFEKSKLLERAGHKVTGLHPDGYGETLAKRSILFKVKEDEDFNRRNTWGILRIKI